MATERRSAYNYKDEAATAYGRLLAAINARYILTSYSTDGMIPLESMLRSNVERGRVSWSCKATSATASVRNGFRRSR